MCPTTFRFSSPRGPGGEGAGVKPGPKPSLDRWVRVCVQNFIKIDAVVWISTYQQTDKQTNICTPIYIYIYIDYPLFHCSIPGSLELEAFKNPTIVQRKLHLFKIYFTSMYVYFTSFHGKKLIVSNGKKPYFERFILEFFAFSNFKLTLSINRLVLSLGRKPDEDLN